LSSKRDNFCRYNDWRLNCCNENSNKLKTNKCSEEKKMEIITFDEWARRNRVDENEDCEQCDGTPSANVKGCCYQTMDDMPCECPRLTKLLIEYHKIRAKEEIKLERELVRSLTVCR
jgi:hypothetical protein